MAITNITPTTELEAVNSMLRAIGEAPIEDVEASEHGDVTLALDILRETCREVQAQGWRFNTEFGLAIAPTVTDFAWEEPDGSETLVDIFVSPSGNMASFTVTPILGQIIPQYNSLVDVVLRPSKQYEVDSNPVMVFYDRARNRDGLPAGKHEFLYIDPVWMFDFEQLPETARRYITTVAARRFAQTALGDATQVSFTIESVSTALRALVDDQGIKEEHSMLNHPDAQRIIGYRPRLTGLFTSRRSRPVR